MVASEAGLDSPFGPMISPKFQSWVSEMTRLYKFGVHTFYRPKKWGDGSDAPSWGTPAQTAALSQQLAAEAKSEAEMYPNSVRR